METGKLVRRGECEWEAPARGAMRVPVVVDAAESGGLARKVAWLEPLVRIKG